MGLRVKNEFKFSLCCYLPRLRFSERLLSFYTFYLLRQTKLKNICFTKDFEEENLLGKCEKKNSI